MKPEELHLLVTRFESGLRAVSFDGCFLPGVESVSIDYATSGGEEPIYVAATDFCASWTIQFDSLNRQLVELLLRPPPSPSWWRRLLIRWSSMWERADAARDRWM